MVKRCLQAEHDTFRDIAERTIEKKDDEIVKLVEDNKNLSHALRSRPEVCLFATFFNFIHLFLCYLSRMSPAFILFFFFWLYTIQF